MSRNEHFLDGAADGWSLHLFPQKSRSDIGAESGFKMKWAYDAISPDGRRAGIAHSGWDSRAVAIDVGTRAVHKHLAGSKNPDGEASKEYAQEYVQRLRDQREQSGQ